MLSERDQVHAWFESLSDDQRAAVMAVDLEDIPGWMIASLVDANLRIDDGADDFKYRVPQVLCDYVLGRRDHTD